VAKLFASAVGILGQAEVTAGVALGLAVARLRRGQSDAWVPLLIVAVVAVEFVVKMVVHQPLLPKQLSRTIELFPFVHVTFAGAFPSGHVARTAFLVGVARVPRWVAVLAVALMMVTRVYLADHWPSDVMSGVLLGALSPRSRRSQSDGYAVTSGAYPRLAPCMPPGAAS